MPLSYSYKIETNSYIVDGGCGDSNIIIPDAFNGPQGELNVTEIASSAFANCSTLTSITFGKYIAHIGSQAFYFCTLLQSVSFPIDSNLISIGDSAFASCAFNQIDLPNTVASIGGGAFQGCSSLATINIPPLVTSISPYTFFLSGLTSIIIPDTVTSIGNYALRCHNLHTVIIGNSVASIGTASFAECFNLVNLTIGENVSSIGNNAFQDCSSLTNLIIPNNVQTINEIAFADCSSLEYVIFGNRISFIGSFAFLRNYSLKNIYFLGNAPSLGTDVFLNTNVNLKIYRYSTKSGWSSTFGGEDVLLIDAPSKGLRTFGFSGISSGKILIKKQNLTSLFDYNANPQNNIYTFKSGTVNTISTVFNIQDFTGGGTINTADVLYINNVSYYRKTGLGAGWRTASGVDATNVVINPDSTIFILYINPVDNTPRSVNSGAIIQKLNSGKIISNQNYILNSKFDADNQYPIADGTRFFDNNYYPEGHCGGQDTCTILTNYRHNSPLLYSPYEFDYHTFANRTFHEINAPYNTLPIGHPIQPRLLKMFGVGSKFGRTQSISTIINTASFAVTPPDNTSWTKYGVEQIVKIPSWATKVVYGVKYLAKSDDLFRENNFGGLKLNFRLLDEFSERNYVNVHLIRRSTAAAVDTLESLYGSNIYRST